MNVRAIHALGGVLFGLPFAASYLWTMGGAVRSRDEFLARAPSALGASVLLGLIGLGALVALATARGPLPGLDKHGPLQRVALVLAVAFAGFHAALVWWPLATGADALLTYHYLRATLPYALPAIACSLGLAFVALHVELSLHAFVDAFGLVRRAQTRRWLQVGVATIAIGFFVLAVNALAVFVSGAPFFGGEPAPAQLFELEQEGPR